MLSDNIWKLTTNVSRFNGEYKPDFDESLMIPEFKVPTEISEAINNPLGAGSLSIENAEIEKIKAIFIVDDPSDDGLSIIFQKFKKTQYLRPEFLKIFFDANTVHSVKKPGLNITDNVDCYYKSGTFYFKSYYIANQIVDLSEYYREATNEDLEMFATKSIIAVEESSNIKETANKWIRKKIASILDSGVLDKHSIEDMIKFAKNVNVNLEVTNKKIVFPEETKNQRGLLKFLSDEIYRGCLSDEIYETNSKKLNQNN